MIVWIREIRRQPRKLTVCMKIKKTQRTAWSSTAEFLSTSEDDGLTVWQRWEGDLKRRTLQRGTCFHKAYTMRRDYDRMHMFGLCTWANGPLKGVGGS